MPLKTVFKNTIRYITVSCLGLIGGFAGGLIGGTSPVIADSFTLELGKAIAQSESINAARQGYLSAREDVVIANKPKEWTATLSGGHKYAETSTDGADFAESNNRDVAVTVKRNLFDGGLASAQEIVALLQLDIAKEQINIAETSLLNSAIEAYTGLATARDQLRISTANVSRLEARLKAAKIQLDVGESTPTQLAGTEARLARAKAGLIQAETALANAEATYMSIIGTPPQKIEMPPHAQNLPNSAQDAGDMALNANASHRIAFLSERIMRKNMDVLVAQVKPNLDFSLVGKTVDNTLSSRDSEEISASVTFSMPLYPSSSVRAKSRGVVADHRQSLYELDDNKRTTRLNAENAYRNYAASLAVIAAYEAELKAALAVRDGTTQEVQFGEKTILDQLDSEQDVVTAQLNLLIANRDLVNASYAVMAVTGHLTAANLNVIGLDPVEDLPEIVSPLKGPYPRLDYTE